MILASRSSRLLAQMVDAMVAFIPFVGLGITAVLFGEIFEVIVGIMAIPALLFCIGYVFFADAMPGGQSYGKRLLGLAVVDKQSGIPCSVGQSLIRNLLLSILGFFDWIFIFGEGHQRLGDRAAGTIVVEAATVGALHQAMYQ